jgi:transposase
MLRLPRTVRIIARTQPVDSCASIDMLVRIVRDELREDPFTGNLFCFFNRRRDRVQILVWDRNGFWTLCKRLERGQFEPLDGRDLRVEISREQFVMLLEGIDTRSSRFRRYFAREVRIPPRADDDRSACSAR